MNVLLSKKIFLLILISNLKETLMQKKQILTFLLFNTIIYAQVTLEDIIVNSSNKTPQQIKNSTANISVITAQEIEENGYTSVAEALSHQAGISFSRNGGRGTVTTLFLRGMKTEKILLLLDGVSLNNPSSTDGQAFFEHISIDNIEQIEIIKGGASAIWGADASAGVINIITKQAKEGIHANALLSYGSFKTKKASASLSYKKNNFDTILSALKFKNEGFSATLPRDSEADGYENTSINVKLGYSFLEQHTLHLNANYIDANTQYDGAFSELKADDNFANINTEQKDLSLNYVFNSTYYTSRLKLIHNTSDRVDLSNSSFGEAQIKYEATQQEIEWINQYTYENSHIIIGVNAKKMEGRYQFNETNATTNDFDDKGIFLTLNHTFEDFTGGKTLIEGAIRQDFFSNFDNQTSYKLGAKHFYKRIQGLSTSINTYKSTDAPNSYQLANQLNNTLLHPDTTKGFDVGMAYKSFSFNYFYTQIDKKLGYFSDNVNFVYGYINNTGKETTKGFEIDLSHTFETLSLIASTNYTHLIKYKSQEGNRLDKRAKDTINASINYYFRERFTFGIDAQYVGDRIEFGKSTGNYTLWNSNISINILKDLAISLHTKNIFDKKYETTSGYSTASRAFYANLNYHF